MNHSDVPIWKKCALFVSTVSGIIVGFLIISYLL